MATYADDICEIISESARFKQRVLMLAREAFKDIEPPTAQTLAEGYLVIAAVLETSILDAHKLREAPDVVLSVHKLVQATASVLWAGGVANSSDFWEMAREWFSPEGWDRYHAAQLEAIDERRREKHHD